MEERKRVANHPSLFFQDAVQKSDLLDVTKTNTYTIAALAYLLDRGNILELTAVHSDHHDDSALNPDDPRHTGTHRGGVEPDGTPTGGFAFDFWFLKSWLKNDYCAATDHQFRLGLTHCSQAPFLHQVGLAGTAVNDENLAAAGATVFVDTGADHVHLGTA